MSMTAVQRNQYNNSKQISTGNNNNNIIIIRDTHPGVSINPEDGNRIIAAYVENIGPAINAPVARLIEDFIKAGHTVDHVIDAIERTGFAPRPSPAYLRAVLRNYDQPRQQPSPWYKQNPALNYQQRQYSDADFSGDDFIEEAKRYIEQR